MMALSFILVLTVVLVTILIRDILSDDEGKRG
jgi:hypothetical protein